MSRVQTIRCGAPRRTYSRHTWLPSEGVHGDVCAPPRGGVHRQPIHVRQIDRRTGVRTGRKLDMQHDDIVEARIVRQIVQAKRPPPPASVMDGVVPGVRVAQARPVPATLPSIGKQGLAQRPEGQLQTTRLEPSIRRPSLRTTASASSSPIGDVHRVRLVAAARATKTEPRRPRTRHQETNEAA